MRDHSYVSLMDINICACNNSSIKVRPSTKPRHTPVASQSSEETEQKNKKSKADAPQPPKKLIVPTFGVKKPASKKVSQLNRYSSEDLHSAL